MSQSPGTTIVNLLDFANRVRLRDAITPSSVREAALAVGIALTKDGRLTDEGLRDRPTIKDRDWFIAGALSAGTNQRRIVSQDGAVVMVWATAVTAPTTTCTIRVTRQVPGSGASEVAIVVIPAGANYGESAVPEGEVAGGSWLGIEVVAHGGAADASIGAALVVT